IMVIYAKISRTELFSLAVASTANIGGIASAPVVAGAFNRQLVPVGVLYALIGSFMGTWIRLAAAQLMSMLRARHWIHSTARAWWRCVRTATGPACCARS